MYFSAFSISDSEKPKKIKSNGQPNSSIQETTVTPPKSNSDHSNTSAAPKAVVHERVTPTTKSDSGPDSTMTTTKEQTANYHPGRTSLQKIPPPKPHLTDNEDYVTIIFHALLSPDFNFKPDKQHVTIRLGHEDLGGWDYNFAENFNAK